jgi:outer membrane protein assembly factor BamB
MQWQHDLVKDFGGLVLKFGTAASPVAHDGKVVVLVGGEKMGVAAFNPADGKIVWQSEPLEVSYATPVLIDVDGQPQFVVMTAEEAVGIAADGGKVLWRHPCKHKYRNNCTDPLWGPGNLLWVATQQDAGTRVLHLTQSGGKTQVREVWAGRQDSGFPLERAAARRARLCGQRGQRAAAFGGGAGDRQGALA